MKINLRNFHGYTCTPPFFFLSFFLCQATPLSLSPSLSIFPSHHRTSVYVHAHKYTNVHSECTLLASCSPFPSPSNTFTLTCEAQQLRSPVHLWPVVAIAPHSSHMTWREPADQTNSHSRHSYDGCPESRRKESE